jgi:HAD superfamily phosphatase (TIGR01681 family)
LNQVILLDLGAELASYDGSAFDPRLEFIGKFPFSDGFSSYLAHRWVSFVIAMLGKDVRLIITDLDNTLWGGVLGEEGIEGLQLGEDYPGNAFKAFQVELLEHHKRGVALGIASKNDEDLAMNAISEMPDMIIRPTKYSNLWYQLGTKMEKYSEDGSRVKFRFKFSYVHRR